MSTYWGYHCKTDDARSDCWINHGDDILRGLALAYPHFTQGLRNDTKGYIEISLMGYGTAPFGWLVEHDGHEIELANEYGEVEPLEEAVAAT